ncbi:hypothetical protein [Caulobacter sp. UNC279MFTsu5.1]|uniref:hypothetical protein n=1 Tax=Caulobacter sp. UNC279MFTsu5.1 TaxID=1502775 RepID=UPI0008E25F95|nr:hypothetical protein [Caulobacter sp. UNC279MFTsu5.1]SFK24422.1 YD repeat-containing protein [Caulobacter sp. UNC279MFTsu5.1]
MAVNAGGAIQSVLQISYDAASRLASLGQDLAGTGQDQTHGYTYNAAGQIKSRTASNDAYQWTGGGAVSRSYGSNGLNPLTISGSLTLAYDGRGNPSSDGARTFGYDVQNQLTSASTGATLGYDPGRLSQISASAATRFLYDGAAIAAKYNASGAMLRRPRPPRRRAGRLVRGRGRLRPPLVAFAVVDG